MYRFLRLSLVLSITTLMSSSSFAAAFQLYELGTPIIGTAAVGQAVVAEDASTAYFNPAGMGLLSNTQVMIGSQMLIPYTNFSHDTSTTIRGDNGGNAGSLIPGANFYYVYNATPKLKLGASLISPYGGSLDYNDGWVGRYVVQGVTFYTINFNPSIAYRFNKWLSLGVGASLEYINLKETVALPIFGLIDGQAKISVANYAPGFNLGMMLNPYPSTKIGIAYRSQIVHHLHGNTTLLRISATPDTTTKMVMPSNVILSAAQDIADKFTLLGELGWADWSSMHNTILSVSHFSAVTPRDWRNTYRYGLGGIFKVNPCLAVRLGASYDSSPTSASKRLPDLPMDRQIRVGAGVTYDVIRQVTLGASYEYINFGRADIDNTSSDGTLSGSYSRNYANTFQVSLNVKV